MYSSCRLRRNENSGHDTGVVTPPGMKSRATVATILRAKMAKMIAKLTTPQTDGFPSSSGGAAGSGSGSDWFSWGDDCGGSDAMRRLDRDCGSEQRREEFRNARACVDDERRRRSGASAQ